MNRPLNIIYCLSGEGRGHASVALSLHNELTSRIPEIKIHFFCGGKAYEFLKKSQMNVFKIPYLSYAYKNGAVRPFATFLKTFYTLIKEKKNTLNILKEHIQGISPVLAICDFEYFVPRAIKSLQIPLLNINHQGIITETSYPVPLKERFNWLGAYISVKMITYPSVLHIILSFFTPPVKKSKKERLFMGPINRPELFKYKDSPQKNFILVYVMDPSFRWIISILKNIKDETFVVTGVPPSTQSHKENITIKDVDPSVFIEDLSACKGIIATAGHTLIGEALMLEKPILALYQPNQFEQFQNAYYLEKLGYGMSCKADKNIHTSICEFLKGLSSFQQNIRNNFSEGNKEAVDAIVEIINSKKQTQE